LTPWLAPLVDMRWLSRAAVPCSHDLLGAMLVWGQNERMTGTRLGMTSRGGWAADALGVGWAGLGGAGLGWERAAILCCRGIRSEREALWACLVDPRGGL
jgi:hypothetical protein